MTSATRNCITTTANAIYEVRMDRPAWGVNPGGYPGGGCRVVNHLVDLGVTRGTRVADGEKEGITAITLALMYLAYTHGIEIDSPDWDILVLNYLSRNLSQRQCYTLLNNAFSRCKASLWRQKILAAKAKAKAKAEVKASAF